MNKQVQAEYFVLCAPLLGPPEIYSRDIQLYDALEICTKIQIDPAAVKS